MKIQNVGNEHDYLKYALLRSLERSGLRLGLCRMITRTPEVMSANQFRYLSRAENGREDPELFAFLRQIQVRSDDQRLESINQAKLLSGAISFDEPLPRSALQRSRWLKDAMRELADAELVFIDPDRGWEVPSYPVGHRDSTKYIYREELAALYGASHSIIFYQNTFRKNWTAFAPMLFASITRCAPGATCWVFRTSLAAFILVGHPKHKDTLSPFCKSNGRLKAVGLSSPG